MIKEKLLKIEQILKEKDDERLLFEKYKILKNELLSHEYIFTNLNMQGINDHGPGHIKRVLERINELIPNEILEEMTLYELFILLCSVIYHDEKLLQVSSIIDKKSHSIDFKEISKFDINNYLTSKIDIEYITKIVELHSGNKIKNVEKSFPNLGPGGYDKIGGDWIAPRFISALLCLADELDEDFRRGEERVKRKSKILNIQRIHWEIPLRIRAINPDPENQQITFTILFKKEDLIKEDYKDTSGKKGSLIEFLLKKMIKINDIRKICNRYFLVGMAYHTIKIALSFESEPEGEESVPRLITLNGIGTYDDLMSKLPLDFTPREINLLPDILDFRTNVIEEEKRKQKRKEEKFVNPFEMVNADSLELKDTSKYFIKEYAQYSAISSGEINTIVAGPRGSGKTMILKYMSIPSQKSLFNTDLKNYLKRQNPYLGIYIKIAYGDLKTPEYYSLFKKDPELANAIFEHNVSIYITTEILSQLKNEISTSTLKNIFNDFCNLLKTNSSISDIEGIINNLRELQRSIPIYISSLSYPTGKEEKIPTIFNFNSLLIPALESLQIHIEREFNLKIPFYLLIDGADNLFEFQQSVLIYLLMRRRFNLFCIKLSTQLNGFKIFKTPMGDLARLAREYEIVNLTTHYTKSGDEYYKRIKKMIEKRLELSGIFNINLKKQFPRSTRENRTLNEVLEEMKEEYKNEDISMRPKKFESYKGKLFNARLFQILAHKKIPKDYSGYDSIIAISSGIASQLLLLLKGITDAGYDAGYNIYKKQSIPPEIQQQKIIEISSEFYKQIDQIECTIEYQHECPDMTRKAKQFMNTITILYRKRLLNKNLRGDCEMTAIAIKDELPREYQIVLDELVRESFLLPKEYPSKSGYKILPAYFLNRILAPRRKLSVEIIQGRIEIGKKEVETIFKDPKKFIKKFANPKTRKKAEKGKQIKLENSEGDLEN